MIELQSRFNIPKQSSSIIYWLKRQREREDLLYIYIDLMSKFAMLIKINIFQEPRQEY